MINLKEITENSEMLLTDFDINPFLKAVNEAISLGVDAELLYLLRPLLSPKVSILALIHSYNKLSESFDVLSTTMSKTSAKSSFGYDPTLIFYLVENVKDDEGTNLEQIYNLPEKSSTSQFIDTLSSENDLTKKT